MPFGFVLVRVRVHLGISTPLEPLCYFPPDSADLWHAASSHALELELELIQTQMTQKPMLLAEVYAHALSASQNVRLISLLGLVCAALLFFSTC